MTNRQLVHLRMTIERPNVEVQIISFDRPHVIWPLDLLEFEEGGPTVAFSETQFGNRLHDSQLEVRQAIRTIEQIEGLAMTVSESTAFIEQRIKETAG